MGKFFHYWKEIFLLLTKVLHYKDLYQLNLKRYTFLLDGGQGKLTHVNHAYPDAIVYPGDPFSLVEELALLRPYMGIPVNLLFSSDFFTKSASYSQFAEGSLTIFAVQKKAFTTIMCLFVKQPIEEARLLVSHARSKQINVLHRPLTIRAASCHCQYSISLIDNWGIG